MRGAAPRHLRRATAVGLVLALVGLAACGKYGRPRRTSSLAAAQGLVAPEVPRR